MWISKDEWACILRSGIVPEQTNLMQRVFHRSMDIGLDNDLARLSGLSNARVDAIRRGEPVSTTEFELLCRALAVDPGAMYIGNASNTDRSPARFRTATAIENPSPMDVRLLSLAAEQGRILGHLLGLLEKHVDLRRHKSIAGIERGIDIWRQGYELGETARDALAPDGPPTCEPAPVAER